MGWEKRKEKQKGEKRKLNTDLKHLTRTVKSDINLKKKGKELAKVSGKSRIYQMGWKKRKENEKERKGK